nr:immunoglobulin heavy chain junction region [Macaca mulatta]
CAKGGGSGWTSFYW